MTSAAYKSTEAEEKVMAFYNEALANWPVPYETKIISTRHGETFVLISGDAHLSPLVLLHGASGNSSTWASDIEAWNQKYKVFALDLPGEAGKSAANRPDWDSPAFVEWLCDALDALGIEKTSILGISQGAWVAMKFAIANPERVEKLVLIAPAGVIADRSSFLLRAIIAKLLGERGVKDFVRALFGNVVVPESVIEQIAYLINQFNPRIGFLPRFTDEELKRLTMPVLLLGGTRDISRDVAKIGDRLIMFLPGLRIKIISEAGHALTNSSQYTEDFL